MENVLRIRAGQGIVASRDHTHEHVVGFSFCIVLFLLLYCHKGRDKQPRREMNDLCAFRCDVVT